MVLSKLSIFNFIVILSILLFGCGDNKFRIKHNQNIFTVSLASNPTTGYQWTTDDYDKNIFKLQGYKYITSNPAMIGSGGNIVFTFEIINSATYPKSSVIKFKHSRSWDPKSATYKEVKVYID
jgi:inhibitor of cysteine peptidase